jgi:hypothetical protein
MNETEQERASSPDTLPEELLKLAEEYPREVLQNPLLPMLCLEDYSQWRSILFYAGNRLLSKELKITTPEQKRRIAAQLRQSPIAALLESVRRCQLDAIKQQAEQAIQRYQSVEDSFAELCPLLLFAFDSSWIRTDTRIIETHLFETRDSLPKDLPYFFIELWESTRTFKSNFDHITNTWEQIEQMRDRGNLHIEVEQMIPLVCDCLLEELSWEELSEKYKHPTLSEGA